jgi:hypothetical protein
MTVYTIRDAFGAMSFVSCDKHAKKLPPVDGDKVTAKPADDDVLCEFCAHLMVGCNGCDKS